MPSRETEADLSRHLRWMTSDALRSWVALGAGFLVAIAALVVFVLTGGGEAVIRGSWGLGSTIGLVLYYLVYLGLTWWIFIRRSPQELRELLRFSNGRRDRPVERLSGADPTTFVLTAVAFALVVVAWTIVDPDTKPTAASLALAGFMVVLSWVVMQVSATLMLARLDVERETLEFPDQSEPGWRDYSYVATLILTGSSTGDVRVRTTEGRRAVSTLSISATVFNTVVIALLVAGFLTLRP